jgi:F-type H+-transporting ATPase subunit delta
MSKSPVARRYALALFEQAEATGVTEPVDADMDLLRQLLVDSREFALLLESPVVSRERKLAATSGLLAPRVQNVTLQLIHLMVEKRREALLSQVVDAYRALRDNRLGILEAQVRTARVLSDEDRRAVVDRLSKLTGKKVRLDVAVDPSLVGGMIVRVGDTVYDGSVANRLANLRERLMYGQSLN